MGERTVWLGGQEREMRAFSLDLLVDSMNIAEEMPKEERDFIGQWVVRGFDDDRTSRQDWEMKMTQAGKIALQVMEEKSFPWPGASNVKFPLITIAALQYHSRVYPALVTLPELVQFQRVVTGDLEAQQGQQPQQQGQQGGQQQPAPPNPALLKEKAKEASARRVSAHLNWQLGEEMEDWEEQHDKALLIQPLMGCVFKKTYFDSSKKRNSSDLVLPQDLVVNYYTKTLESSPRVTHILAWDSNEVKEKERRGEILECEYGTVPSKELVPFGELQNLQDTVQGMARAPAQQEQPNTILEQHCWIDLDGDGYKEPYVAFVRYDTKELLRLVARFLPSGVEMNEKGEVVKIVPESFFTKISFIPSPDGGFYDLGFGALLGPLNVAIDTALNQIIDTATLANAGGGFLGRGAKVKGGEIALRPGLFTRVDSTGDDLRKSILPYPVPQPSSVLLQVISILIDYGQRVAGAPDVVQGQNPGQNTPAETSRNMNEQGLKVFSGIYKRTYRALKSEVKKLHRLNSLYLDKSQEFVSLNSGFEMKVLKEDYKLPASVICLGANPEYLSDAQRMAQADALMQAAHSNPGYDLFEVNQFYLRSRRIPNPEIMMPDPKGPSAIPAPPNPKLQIEQLRLQAQQMEMQLEMKMKLMELMEEHDLNRAQILKLEADAVHAMAQADGVQAGHQLALLDAQIGMEKVKQEGRLGAMKLLKELIDSTKEGGQGNDQG